MTTKASSLRTGLLLLAALVLLSVSPRVGAQSFSTTHAKIQLLSEDGAFKPGQTSWIGLYFNMEPGWHIYWINPGDAGEPPKVQWTLPKGFRTGDFRWPTPSRMTTGSVVDYGYQGKVLLAAPLEVPADYKPGTAATLSADIRYLICSQVCIPAKGQATLRVPQAKGATPEPAARIFQDTRQSWPKPLPAGSKAQAAYNGKNFVLSLDSGSPETKAFFFPVEEDQVDNDAPQTTTSAGNRVQITLKKSDQLQKPLPTLKGVVVLGSGRAFEVAAPVTNSHLSSPRKERKRHFALFFQMEVRPHGQVRNGNVFSTILDTLSLVEYVHT
jgi:thiol:disulfide interchange protein DsbD